MTEEEHLAKLRANADRAWEIAGNPPPERVDPVRESWADHWAEQRAEERAWRRARQDYDRGIA